MHRLAGKDLDPPDKVIPISFNAMQSSQPRRCSPRIKKQTMQRPYPADKLQVDHISSLYKPQVLLKRLPEILTKNIQPPKPDTSSKVDQPKPPHIVPKPKITYQSSNCNNNKLSLVHSPTIRQTQKKP